VSRGPGDGWQPGHVRVEHEVLRRAGRGGSRVLPYVAWPLVLVAVVTVLLRLAGASGQAYLALALGLLPLTLLPCYPILVAAAFTRRRGLAVVSLVLVVAHLVFIWPAIRPAADVGALGRGAPTLTVLSFNTAGDKVDAAALYRLIERERPDVVALLELSPRTAAALDKAGLAATYPHRLVKPADKALAGAGLYSRIPIEDASLLPTVTSVMPGATVRVGGIAVRVQAVHTAPPLGGLVGRWQAEHVALVKLARDRREALVLAGDFNSGRQHAVWRELAAAGLTDAHEARARGIVRTWPDDRALLPALLDLDHVMVSRELVVLAVSERSGLGSDHKALVTDLAVTDADAARP
jgi:endonuclease/exonuclease/phosphatase (EEP) superfamily protein YafD